MRQEQHRQQDEEDKKEDEDDDDDDEQRRKGGVDRGFRPEPGAGGGDEQSSFSDGGGGGFERGGTSEVGNDGEWDSHVVQELMNEFAKNASVSSEEVADVEGVALLKQIFPDEPVEELKRLHRDRVLRGRRAQQQEQQQEEEQINSITGAATTLTGSAAARGGNNIPTDGSLGRHRRSPKSNLGRRIWGQLATADASTGQQTTTTIAIGVGAVEWRDCILPHDFLRLPPQIAVRRLNANSLGGAETSCRYELVSDLEQRALGQHQRLLPMYRRHHHHHDQGDCEYFSRSIFRDARVGLGLSLCEQDGIVRVHSFPSASNSESASDGQSPALRAGIRRGDILIGVNGTALAEYLAIASHAGGDDGVLLKYAVLEIRNSPDPTVLHFEREIQEQQNGLHHGNAPTPSFVMLQGTTPSLLDTSDILNDSSQLSISSNHLLNVTFHSTPMTDDVATTPFIHPFVATLRAHGLLKSFEDERSCTLALSQYTERARQWEATSSFRIANESYRGDSDDEILIPLIGVRPALSVRIVNSFQDGKDSAFTIWVYDVATGTEWYSPIRYFRDFQDLRSATVRLNPVIAHLPFPRVRQPALSLFGSPVNRQDSDLARESKCQLLERFLRSLTVLIYRDGVIHPNIAEISIHVQSFLGCENIPLDTAAVVAHQTSYSDCGGASSDASDDHVRVQYILKRNIQLYTYRLFMIPQVAAVVDAFVDSVRAKGPRLEDLESLEAQGRSVLKARATEDLEQLKAFLDKMQDIILEGCRGDFLSIAERDEYDAAHEMIHNRKREAQWDRLIREVVREQVEIEAYVPLRSIVSRWLVQGWRHEDMEVQFKIKELRKRPQKMFRIREDEIDPTIWSSVSNILKEGVGHSTLPCAKLRAIVESAREICRLFASSSDRSERAKATGDANENRGVNLGADDFLPIFIYCVVQAEMERPCALCVLLRALCDPVNRMGEIGYYLASFEAAITHIQEVDLTDDREEMLSFLSVPISDT